MRFPSGMNATPGLSFGNDMAVMLSPATVAVGDCLALDLTTVDTSYRWTTMRAVATADFATANAGASLQTMVAISLDPATTAGTKIRCVFRGQVAALCVSATTVGVTRLSPTNNVGGLTLSAAATGTGQRIVAVALETNANANVLKQVMFDGASGVLGATVITNSS